MLVVKSPEPAEPPGAGTDRPSPVAGPVAVRAGTGAFSPQGWFAPVVGLTFAGWLLAISLAAWRPARPAAATG